MALYSSSVLVVQMPAVVAGNTYLALINLLSIDDDIVPACPCDFEEQDLPAPLVRTLISCYNTLIEILGFLFHHDNVSFSWLSLFRASSRSRAGERDVGFSHARENCYLRSQFNEDDRQQFGQGRHERP